MKITDLTLVFVAVLLPVMVILYINISFNIKAGEQELYYKKIIDTAAQDAANQMKEVENEDTTIDYGYSGNENEKVSVNSQIAVDTFFNNLYNNFGIKGNDAAQRYLQLFVPAIAIIDYDGVQISSIETYTKNGESITEHTLKPKRYYTFDYTIVPKSDGSGYTMANGIVETNAKSFHHVEFTMDDYITHRYSDNTSGDNTNVKSFYIEDSQNNKDLIGGINDNALLNEVTTKLKEMRKDILVDTVVKEMTYAVNNNNFYARNAGITYTFAFPTTTQDEMYASIENIGFMAFVQGISIGNKFLNTKAYGINSLELSTRYYFSINENDTYHIDVNYYHKDVNCPLYKSLMNKKDASGNPTDNPRPEIKLTPRYVSSKQQATMANVLWTKTTGSGENKVVDHKEYTGFYPCPVCNP